MRGCDRYRPLARSHYRLPGYSISSARAGAARSFCALSAGLSFCHMRLRRAKSPGTMTRARGGHVNSLTSRGGAEMARLVGCG